jgi:hypothetical protein
MHLWHAACFSAAIMRKAGASTFRMAVIVSLGGLLGCAASPTGVSPPTDASADATGDVTLPDDELADVAAACPSQQPSGRCSGSPSCAYGCTSCQCTGGVWFCMEPSCPAVCLGVVPNEGEPCVTAGGACCNVGIGVGETCPFTCGGGTGSATCELAPDASEAAWHLSSPCSGTLDGGDAGSSDGGDATTVDGGDAATGDSAVGGGDAGATDGGDAGSATDAADSGG